MHFKHGKLAIISTIRRLSESYSHKTTTEGDDFDLNKKRV